MANNKNEVAIKTEKGVVDWLNSIAPNLEYYSGIKNEEFLRSVALCFVSTPSIMECLSTPNGKASVYNALKYAASTGLSLNPQEGKAAIIAFNGKAQYQVMKNGMIEKAMESGKIESIVTDAVMENDIFEMTKTMNGDEYKFSPARTKRGKVQGVFAVCKFKTGKTQMKYMTVEKIENHRDKYSSMFEKNPAKSPWNKSFNGMAIKTVLKDLFRNLYVSNDLDIVIGTDDGMEAGNIINVTPEITGEENFNNKLDEKTSAKKQKKTPPHPEEKEDLF